METNFILFFRFFIITAAYGIQVQNHIIRSGSIMEYKEWQTLSIEPILLTKFILAHSIKIFILYFTIMNPLALYLAIDSETICLESGLCTEH